MRDKEMLAAVDWHKPDQDEQERLKAIKSGNRSNNVILIISILFIITVSAFLLPGMIENLRYLSVIPIAIIVAVLVFIIRRIHIGPDIEVADVTVEKVKCIQTDSTWTYVADLIQGDNAVRDIRIIGERPEEGSDALLVTLNRDPYSTYVIRT